MAGAVSLYLALCMYGDYLSDLRCNEQLLSMLPTPWGMHYSSDTIQLWFGTDDHHVFNPGSSVVVVVVQT